MVRNQAPVEKGKVYEVEITGINHEGAGVGRVNNFAVFIPGSIPGEKERIRILEVKKNFAYGAVEEVIVPASCRLKPDCGIYERCGGCQFQHMEYQFQLKIKRQLVEDSLRRIGKLEDVMIRPTIGMQKPWAYRNKAQFQIGLQAGKAVGGFYEPQSYNVIELENCPIQHPKNNETFRRVKETVMRFGLPIYDKVTGKGILRHIVVKTGYISGEVMVVLVTNEERLPNRELIIQELLKNIPGLVSIVQNINTQRTNIVFGQKSKLLAGKEKIQDFLGDLKFHISAESFYQVNPVQTEVLYNKALEYASLTGKETVIDAYCGIGTISLFLAKKAKKVYGVEVVQKAILDAKENAQINDINNVEFLAGKSEEVIPQLYRKGVRADVVLVDPPRKGCDQSLLKTIVDMDPKWMVYISCNPSTLARDLGYLNEHGYKIKEVQPVDMFPQTAHVECIVQIKRAETRMG